MHGLIGVRQSGDGSGKMNNSVISTGQRTMTGTATSRQLHAGGNFLRGLDLKDAPA